MRIPAFRFVLLLGILAVGACARGGDAPDDAALKKVRVAFSPYVSWGPLMIAKAEGFFRDEGLEIEFVSALHSEESLVSLATGDIDVRPGPLSAGFLSAVAQGAPIRITAGMGYLERNSCTYFGIILRRGLDTAHTPTLKRMRTSQDGYTRFLVTRMLAHRKMTLETIETIRLPAPVMVSSLQSGAIDAVAASEPTLSRVAAAGNRWLSAQESSPDFQWGIIAFGERFLSRERDLGVRFMRAYRRGMSQYLQGKTPRNVAIIAEATGETPEATRDACWPAFQSDARINWASIVEFQAWARTVGLMERSVSEAQVWDSSFAAATDSAAMSRRP